MKNLNYLRMEYIFSQRLKFTKEEFSIFIKENSLGIDPIIMIGNVLSNFPLNSSYSYPVVKQYCDYISDKYGEINKSITFLEKKWISFYFLLSIIKYDTRYCNDIYTQYKILPKIFTLKEEQKIIAQRMLPYYFEKKLDYTELKKIYEGEQS